MGIRSTRWSALAIVGALALGVAACGGDDEPEQRRRARPERVEAAEDRRLPAAHGRVLRAGQGGQAGLRGLAVDGQREGRPARAQGRARDQGRRLQPEHGRLRLQRADLAATRSTCCSARSPRCSTCPPRRSPSARRCSTSSPRAATRTSSAAASRWCSSPSRRRPRTRATRGRTGSSALPDDKQPKTAAYPTLDDPFAAPTSEGIENDPQGGRDPDRLPRDVHRRPEELRRDRRRDQGQEPGPDRGRHAVRGRHRASCARSPRSTSRRSGSTRPTRRRSATSTSRASAPRSTEGVFYAVSHSQESDTPGNPEFVAKYKEMFGGENVPEDAADAYAAGAGPAGHGRGQQDGRAGRPAQAGRLAAREPRADDPRRPGLERGRQPEGRVPRRPVAERQAGDRAARGRGDV